MRDESDESDESEEGDPAGGPEEPAESPDADPERGSAIDPSDLERRADDAESDCSTGADENGADGTADPDADGADTDDSSLDAADAGVDDGLDADEDDTRAEGDDSDTGADDDGGANADDPEVDVGGADGTDDGDAEADDDGDEDDVTDDTIDDAGDTDDSDTTDDTDDEGGADDTTDDAGRSVGDLDGWPSVKPDPVDIDSDDAESESGPEAGDESDDADGPGDSHTEDDADDADGVDEGISAEELAEDTASEDGDDSDLPEAQTDGEGYVHGPGGQDSGYGDGDEDLGGISTPPDDQEMPLADHIEEMILRLAVVFLFGAAGTAVGLLGASPAIDYIWQNVLPATLDAPPHVYHPLELWLTRVKVAALLGILVGLPMFVYQCYRFMRPGLYPNERKYYLSAVPMSLVLAVVGMYISFVLVLPILFRYFTFYSEGSAGIAYALGETFNLIITLTGFLAIVFQIPLFIMLAIMMGVTTRQWLANKRLYFWAAFFGLSFMFTMDPTLMAPIIVAIIMVALFEGTLLLLRWTGQE